MPTLPYPEFFLRPFEVHQPYAKHHSGRMKAEE